MDQTGTVVVYERIGDDGKGTIWAFGNVQQQFQVTWGAAAGERLPNTPYVVGGDADPDVSPDNSWIVFRRLTAAGDGRGYWDILRVASGAVLPVAPLAAGPTYRGAPDWGEGGIAFVESDPATGGSALVVVDAQGEQRRVVTSVPRGYELSFPRWMPKS